MPDYVNIVGLTAWQVNQVAVGTAAAQVATTPLAGRKTISVKALAANSAPVYIGPTAGVTTGTGYELAAGDSIDMELSDAVGTAIYAISTSSGQRVCWAEVA